MNNAQIFEQSLETIKRVNKLLSDNIPDYYSPPTDINWFNTGAEGFSLYWHPNCSDPIRGSYALRMTFFNTENDGNFKLDTVEVWHDSSEVSELSELFHNYTSTNDSAIGAQDTLNDTAILDGYSKWAEAERVLAEHIHQKIAESFSQHMQEQE